MSARRQLAIQYILLTEEGSASGIPLSYSTPSQPYFHALLELRLARVRVWQILGVYPSDLLNDSFRFRVGFDAGTSWGPVE
jgi:hypothetical protein